jgi:hypothetical protein
VRSLTYGERRITQIAEAAAARKTDPTRHKCFVSYHHADQDEAEAFIDAYGDVFIARAIGVSDEDDFIDSDDTEYVMRRIRELYLTDSTVSVVLIGKCTWARRYADWEIASSLRNDPNNTRNGLLGITLKSIADYSGKRAPDRLNDNLDSDDAKAYARWIKYPTSAASLRGWIDDAYNARTQRAALLDNSRELFKNNRSCS